MKRHKREKRPSITEIESELSLLKVRKSRNKNIGYIIIASLVAAAIIILATNLWFPIYRVVGTSMTPQLEGDDIIVCLDAKVEIERGNIIAFYHNDTVLLKRVVGIPGDIVEMDEDGVLYINGEEQDEPYAAELSLEPCDIEFPIEVSEDSYFVLGDQRTTSMDSRAESIGMITKDRLIGRALARVWPISKITAL